MRRTVCFIAIILAMLLLFSACKTSPGTKTPSVNDLSAYEYNFKSSTTSFNANIYIISAANTLEHKSTNIEIYSGLSPLNALIETLIVQNNLDADSKYKFKEALLSDETCILFFTGTFPTMNEWAALEALLLVTLNDFCGVTTITMCMNGYALSYHDLPITAARLSEESPDEYIEKRIESLTPSKKSVEIDSTVVCFIPDFDSELIYATPAAIQAYSQNSTPQQQVKAVLDIESTALATEYRSYTQADVTTGFKSSVSISNESDSGTYSFSVELTKAEGFNMLTFYLIKALSLAIYTNVPNVDMVRFSITNKDEYSTNIWFEFDDILPIIGTPITTYYPITEDSTLERKQIFVESTGCYDVSVVTKALLNNSAGTLMPNISSKLLGVYLDNRIVAIDFDKNSRTEILLSYINADEAYDSPEMRERLLIYGIVNTLTELPTVNGVIFYENGNPVDSLVNIYLKRPISRNPGLIAD